MHCRLTNEKRGALKRYTQTGSYLNIITLNLRANNQVLKKKDIFNERAKL